MPFSCSHTTHAQQPSTLARFRVFRTEKMQCFARKVHHTYKTLSDRYTPQSLNTRPDQSLPDQSPRTQNRSTWVRPTRIVAAPRKCTNLFTLTKNRLFHRSRTKARQRRNIFPLTCNAIAPACCSKLSPSSLHRCGFWWRRTGSNRRPPACKAGALPAELRPQSSQRSLSVSRLETTTVVVGQGGLEPPTPRLSSVCSNQLSY